MRRYHIWYVLAIGWSIAALAGFLRHRAPQALPAAIFAVVFAIIGILVKRRDDSIRQKRASHMNG